jgi:hypothetical protein
MDASPDPVILQKLSRHFKRIVNADSQYRQWMNLFNSSDQTAPHLVNGAWFESNFFSLMFH